MSYAETILLEFDREMANTRKVLERISDDNLDWQAHPKSRTIGWNANHVADIVTRRMMDAPEPPKVFTDFWTPAYGAME